MKHVVEKVKHVVPRAMARAAVGEMDDSVEVPFTVRLAVSLHEAAHDLIWRVPRITSMI